MDSTGNSSLPMFCESCLVLPQDNKPLESEDVQVVDWIGPIMSIREGETRSLSLCSRCRWRNQVSPEPDIYVASHLDQKGRQICITMRREPIRFLDAKGD